MVYAGNVGEPTRVRCLLVLDGGASRRVGASGVVIGRARDCDLVTRDPSASRRHALVRLAGDGVELVPLGREPVAVNGRAIARPRALADGDRVAVPGLALAVQIEAAPPTREAATGYVLERERGGNFGISHTPFVIGGGGDDDLIVKRWPPALIQLHVAQGELFAELASGKAERNGVAIAPGVLEPLVPGDRLGCRGETFAIAAADPSITTGAAARADVPRRVEIELLPRGGRVVFSLASGERAVYLADRRFDLMMALLQPPAGRAGEFVADDAVRAIVWPRKPSVSRPEINMLISRCRRDLVEAGLAGPRLVERAPGGGGTRIVVAPGAEIVVKR